MDEEMKRELNGIKQAIADLTQVIVAFKDEVRSQFKQVDARFEKQEADTRRIAISVAHLQCDTADMKRDMATKQDVAHQARSLMSFMTEIQNARKLRANADKSFMRHEDRLDKHERRIARLEARRA